MSDEPNIQDYDVIAPIAKGGFGEVWLAANVLGVYQAIKIVKWAESSKESHEGKLRHYQAEFNGIKAYAPISQKHDGLLDIFHAAIREEAGYYYYVLPLADDLVGGDLIYPPDYTPKTLSNYLKSKEEGRLSAEESSSIIQQVAFALHQLHGEGRVHRDIKPDNIICVNGRWHLSDIGLVATQGAETFVGTLGYIAPEGPGRETADIFSLGRVLYQICTGNPPDAFPNYPDWAFGKKELREELLEVNNIFCKACDSNPRERYQSALELYDEFSGEKIASSTERRGAVKPRARTLKDYIYVSKPRVKLLAAQLPQTHFSQAESDDAIYKNLETVVDYLDADQLIGNISSPKKYFKGKMRMRLRIFSCGEGFYATGETEQGKVVSLMGSMKHGAVAEVAERSKSFSNENLDVIYDQLIEHRGGGFAACAIGPPLDNMDLSWLLYKTHRQITYGGAPAEEFEFVARTRLQFDNGKTHESFQRAPHPSNLDRSEEYSVLLGTPLFIERV